MTDDELEAQPPARQLTSRRAGSRPPRMATPIQGGLREITPEPPAPREPDPVLDLTPDEPYDEAALVEAEPITPATEVVAEAETEPALESSVPEATGPESAAEPEGGGADAADEPAPAAQPTEPAEPAFPATVRETLRVVDESWREFHAMAARFPSERMDEHLTEDGWTRKQMLFHIAAWHDVTADRLIKFLNTGQPPDFDQDTDQFNAMAARRAVGKTAGEVLNDTEATYNRLRRQMQRLTDPQLRQFDSWAAWVIHGNTYGHYEEHRADVYIPEPPPGTARR